MRSTAKIPFEELAQWTDPTGGNSDRHALTLGSCEQFARAIAGPSGPTAIDPDEVPPMLLVGLLPRLLREAFDVVGAQAQELVYVERLRLLRPAAIGQEVELAVTFLAAQVQDAGLIGVRLGLALHLVDDEIPLLVGEVGLLCGNPPVDQA
jgi:hypothetical protein